MRYIKVFALIASLYVYTSIEAKNIFASLLCCCKQKTENVHTVTPVPSQVSTSIAPSDPTPIASTNGSSIEGYLRIVGVVEHPAGFIPPNPTPVSGITHTNNN